MSTEFVDTCELFAGDAIVNCGSRHGSLYVTETDLLSFPQLLLAATVMVLFPSVNVMFAVNIFDCPLYEPDTGDPFTVNEMLFADATFITTA